MMQFARCQGEPARFNGRVKRTDGMTCSALSRSEVIGAISTATIVVIGTQTTVSIAFRPQIIGYRGRHIDDRNSPKRRKFVLHTFIRPVIYTCIVFPIPKTPPLPTKTVIGQSRWRTFLLILGRVTLVTLITSAGTFYYVTQKDRHPGAQLPFDPEKKTIVVLGSGWGATSLLKTLDTTDYNVVSIYRSDWK